MFAFLLTICAGALMFLAMMFAGASGARMKEDDGNGSLFSAIIALALNVIAFVILVAI